MMKLSEILDEIGNPVVYYPDLARFFGSIEAAIFFAQLAYWHDKSAHEYQYQTSAKLQKETGLNPRAQKKAKQILTDFMVVDIKFAPLQHETHYRVIEEELKYAWSEWILDGKPDRLIEARRRVPKGTKRDELGRFLN